MKQKISAILAVAMMCMSLTACGGKDITVDTEVSE